MAPIENRNDSHKERIKQGMDGDKEWNWWEMMGMQPERERGRDDYYLPYNQDMLITSLQLMILMLILIVLPIIQ